MFNNVNPPYCPACVIEDETIELLIKDKDLLEHNKTLTQQEMEVCIPSKSIRVMLCKACGFSWIPVSNVTTSRIRAKIYKCIVQLLDELTGEESIVAVSEIYEAIGPGLSFDPADCVEIDEAFVKLKCITDMSTFMSDATEEELSKFYMELTEEPLGKNLINNERDPIDLTEEKQRTIGGVLSDD